MVVRWNALLLAGVLAGGSMLIENSHRFDTGAPDVEIVAASTCDGGAAGSYVWRPFTLPTSEDGDETVSAQPPTGCTSD